MSKPRKKAKKAPKGWKPKSKLPAYLLTLNTTDPLELAKLLRTERVPAVEVEVGDVVIDDHSVWHVAKRIDNGDGTYELLDGDDNGININTRWSVTILARDLFEKEDPLDQIRSILEQPETDDATYVLREVYEHLGMSVPDFLETTP